MHTPDERHQAVQAALTLTGNGSTANQAANTIGNQYGVTGRTIQRWAQTAGTPLGELSHDTAKDARKVQAEHHAAKREQLRVALLDKSLDLLNRMDEPVHDFRGKDAAPVTFDRAPAGDVRNLAVAVGILVDKLRLESGEATSRGEHLSGDLIDAEIKRLESQLAAKQ